MVVRRRHVDDAVEKTRGARVLLIGGSSSRRSIGGDMPVGLFHRSSLDAASSAGASSTTGSSPSISTEMM
jgi:hypothetical protein